MPKFEEIQAKTLLNKYKYRDNWFWCRYGINPYRGCAFACNYCDAITEKYLVHEDFEDFSRIIYVKANAPEVLKKEIKKVERDVVALSGVTDAYQPAERKYEITRRILEILADNNFPVHIITKSDLVLRDIDILSEISKNSWCTVSFTITTFNGRLLRLLEPFAPSPERRLKAVEKLNENGVQAGVDFTPIIPYILDSKENMREVIERAAIAKARYILPGAGMTLRSNQKTRFLELLKKNFPELIEKYKELYGTSQEPRKGYVVEMNREAFRFCQGLGIPIYILPPVFKVERKKNFEVATLLLLIAYLKEKREGEPYAAWAYHKAAKTIEEVKENIQDIHKGNQLRKIRGIGESLAKVIAKFLDTGKCEKLEKLKEEW